MGNTISQQSFKVSLFLIGLLLMPHSVLAENKEQKILDKVNFKDVYCSEGCDWQIRECPILGFQIASMLDRKTDKRVDKLVFLRNDIAYGARHEKIREPDDAFVSVRNPTIVHQVKKIFPEIGDDFIAGINQVCGYEERVKKAKADEIN